MARRNSPAKAPELTPEEIAMRDRRHLTGMIERRLEMIDADMAAFAKRVVESADDAFEWSQKAFDQAGEQRLLRRAHKMLMAGATLEAIAKWATDESRSVMDNLLSSRSTSPAVNEMALCRAKAWKVWLPILLRSA